MEGFYAILIWCIATSGTHDLVPRPSNGKMIGHKWGFKTKLLPDGSLDMYKSRVMGKGFQ